MRLLAYILSCASVSAAVVTSNVIYSSSIDPISLTAIVKHTNGSLSPVLVCCHGWSGDASDWNATVLANFATSGWFVVAVDMRGRRTSEGAEDGSGREIMDIADAVTFCRTNFAGVASTNQAVCYGISGGGGNTLAAASKLPDFFAAYVSYFGISDYGVHPTESWYFKNTAWQSSIREFIGGDTNLTSGPTNILQNYQSRDATTAITNLVGGWLFAYHKNGDTAVNVTNTGRIKDALDGSGLLNYTIRFSDDLYTHDYPSWPPDSFDDWGFCYSNTAAWSVPASGAMRVNGYLVTKRFTIWLGGGTNQVGDFTYNTSTHTYTISPITTNGLDVVFAEIGTTNTLTTNISETTTFSFPYSVRAATVSGTLSVGKITRQ